MFDFIRNLSPRAWQKIAIVAIIVGVIFATVALIATDNTTAATTPKPTTKQPAKEVQAAVTTQPQSTEPAIATDTPAPNPAAAPAKKKTGTSSTSTTVPAPQQIAAPQIPQTPPPTPEVPPVEEPQDTHVVVAPGAASQSYSLSTEDGSSVIWYSCNAAVVLSDDQVPDKPAFKVFFVLESAVMGETGLMPASSITFHVRATADAPLGYLEYTGGDHMVSLSLAFCIADESYNIIQIVDIPVLVKL